MNARDTVRGSVEHSTAKEPGPSNGGAETDDVSIKSWLLHAFVPAVALSTLLGADVACAAEPVSNLVTSLSFSIFDIFGALWGLVETIFEVALFLIAGLVLVTAFFPSVTGFLVYGLVTFLSVITGYPDVFNPVQRRNNLALAQDETPAKQQERSAAVQEMRQRLKPQHGVGYNLDSLDRSVMSMQEVSETFPDLRNHKNGILAAQLKQEDGTPTESTAAFVYNHLTLASPPCYYNGGAVNDGNPIPEEYDYTKAYNTFNLTNTTSFAISYLNPLFNALRTPGELFTNVIGKAVNLLVGFRPPKYKSIASYKSLVEEDSYFTPKAPRLSETDIHNDKTDDPRDAYWSTDKAFGAQRVSGLNPTLINKVTSMADLRMRFTDGSESEFVSILTEKDIENASALEGQKVSSMIEEGKLYYVDYAELLASYNPRLKYAYGQSLLSLVDLDREGQVLPKPLVVLELIEEKADDGSTIAHMEPMLIVLRDDYTSKQDVQVCAGPRASGTTNRVSPTAWIIAKTMCQCADAVTHELRTHLGRTHMAINPFAISFSRNLPEEHPIHAMVTAHTWMMMSKNRDAVLSLAQPNGFVNKLLSGDIQGLATLVDDSVKYWSIKKFAFPYEMMERGFNVKVGGPNAPSPHFTEIDASTDIPDPFYGYRDDGVLYWNALNKYVTDYVSLVYGQTDAEFAAAFAKDEEMKQVLDDLNDAKFGPTITDDGEVEWNYVEADGCRAYFDGPYTDNLNKKEGKVLSEAELVKSLKAVPDFGTWCSKPDKEMREDFILMLTTILMVGSYNHSYINYGQYEYYIFAPNQPLSVYRGLDYFKEVRESTKESSDVVWELLVPVLPSSTTSRLLTTIITTLAGFFYDRLGYVPYGVGWRYNKKGQTQIKTLADGWYPEQYAAPARDLVKTIYGGDGTKQDPDDPDCILNKISRNNEKRPIEARNYIRADASRGWQQSAPDGVKMTDDDYSNVPLNSISI